MSCDWDPVFHERSPIFEPLRPIARELDNATWPDLDELSHLAAAKALVTASGIPIRFVPQRRAAQNYESRVYFRGEVQTRPRNWHDLLNALVWLTFPRAKAALNARHLAALAQRASVGGLNRGPIADALTLFDEGGIIVVSSSARLLELLTTFQWKALFWASRNEVLARMKFLVLGHALYEKALEPYLGVTGRAVLFEVETQWLGLPLDEQLRALDAMLSACIADRGRFQTTLELTPLPVLGVPGWDPENTRAAYYDNTQYFRGRERRYDARVINAREAGT